MTEEYIKENLPANEEALELFETDLVNAGLSDKTIRRHLSNAGFYINQYLLYYEGEPYTNGITLIENFLGSFFIRKCMWSTPASIRSTATSIKKFYKSMLDHGKINKLDYSYLCSTIKDCMEDWQYTCEQYNNPGEENPFSWFF